MRPIDADYFIKRLDACDTLKGIGLEPVMAIRDVKLLISVMPKVDAVPVKHGRWIENEGFYGDCYYTCSVCQSEWTMIEGTPAENKMRYCPECGAKMDLEGE